MLYMNVMTQWTIWFVVAIALIALLLLGATLAVLGVPDVGVDVLAVGAAGGGDTTAAKTVVGL